MKFGGTSMGSAERMRLAAEIVSAETRRRPVVVVVSAMSKITDLLLETMRRAELGDRSVVDQNIEDLLARHLETCASLFGPGEQARSYRDSAAASIRSLVAEFQRITGGILMLGERPPRSVDEAVAIGERLSSILLATYLESTGVSAKAVNASEVIMTDAVF